MKKNIDKDKENKEESSLRPLRLEEYIGQEKIVNNLRIFIGAAKSRDECLDHILLYGPPGLGKTTLAYIIALEMGTSIKVINAPSIEKPGDLAAILSSLSPGDILFIDEIHRLPLIVEEAMYSALEDYVFQTIINKDTTPKTIEIPLPPFTLVGATTKIGSISSPLRSRFGYIDKLNFYKEEELVNIILRTSRVLNTEIDDKVALEIAKRSRGTPRIANRIFKRVRDYANYYGRVSITKEDAKKTLASLEIDDKGLNSVDIRYLKTLIYRFNGGPIGLETLAYAIGEDRNNLEDYNEPYLLQLNMIDRTPKGRIATEKAYKHLHINMENK